MCTHRCFRPLVCALALALPAACGSDSDDRPAPVNPTKDAGSDANSGVDAGTDAGVDASCPAGAQRECKVNLPKQGNVVNCFVGVQYCEDAGWSACQEPRDQ